VRDKVRIGSDEETDSERYPDPILSVDEGSGDPIANEQANALMGLTPAFLKPTRSWVVMPVKHFGIDADKAFLTTACHQAAERPGRLGNNVMAIDGWLKGLPANSVLAVEATGTCHQLLLQRAVHHGLQIYLLNPRDVRHYAESLRRRAKTDQVDAQVIARYVAREQDNLRPYVEPPASAAELERLLRRRALIVRTQNQLTLGLSDLDLPEIAQLHTRYRALLRTIDRRMDELIAQDEQRARQREQLRSIPGVGPLNSAALLSLFWRLPGITADALIAFVGFDPRPRESGKYRGKRKLSKRGDPEIRRLGYMAAKTFARLEIGQPLYERYRQRGFSATATYVILARKILHLAHALVTKNTFFDAKIFAAACNPT
jgi:transposase